MTRPVLALLVSLCLAPALAAADPAPAGGLAYTPPASPAAPDPAGLLARLVGLTAAMLGLCGVVFWLARRANPGPGAKVDAAGRLRHDGTLGLDRRCAVHLIRADGQAVAVTTDATGLRSIVLLSEPFEQALAEATPGRPTR